MEVAPWPCKWNGMGWIVLISKLPLGCGGEDGLADHDPPLSGQHLQRHQQQLTQCQGRIFL